MEQDVLCVFSSSSPFHHHPEACVLPWTCDMPAREACPSFMKWSWCTKPWIMA